MTFIRAIRYALRVHKPGEKAGRPSLRNRPDAVASLLVIAIGLCSASCSLLLDFDKPIEAGREDAASPDGSGSEDATAAFDATNLDASNLEPDAQTAANCAAYEPNDSLDEPIGITPMSIDAAICPDADQDFYSFFMLNNTNLSITLVFDNANSDLNLTLYNSMGAVVAAAVGTDSTEAINRGPALGNALPGGAYRIAVPSVTGYVSVDYTLTLTLTPEDEKVPKL